MTVIPKLTQRDASSHKGTYGRVLIVGGSRGMSGAAALSASAATRAGAGLVTVAVPDRCLETVAGYEPNYMTVAVADDADGRFAVEGEITLRGLSRSATSIGIGPGMGRSPAITRIVTTLYQSFPGPMVVDADALNALAEGPTILSKHVGPRVLTPHIGEFRRLIGERLTPTECRERAKAFAASCGIVLVLKGHASIVTDGDAVFVNDTGNPGMATGGSGDVLTGVICGLLGQGLTPFQATVLGVHSHGLAGDFAANKYGELSVVAESIKDCLSEAFQTLRE